MCRFTPSDRAVHHPAWCCEGCRHCRGWLVLPSRCLRVRVVRRVYLSDLLLRIGLFFYSLIQQHLLSLMVDSWLVCDVLVLSAMCSPADTGLKERVIYSEYSGKFRVGGWGARERRRRRTWRVQGGCELVMKDRLLARG